MIEARVIEKMLTDGSKAYDVEIRQMLECAPGLTPLVAATITLPANSAGEADALVARFVDAVNHFTQEQAKRTD